jgi:uncharacterized membrane protein YdbT with pleckstrin-like domain
MGFIEKNLATNEQIIFQTKFHWAVFRRGVVFLIIGTLLIAVPFLGFGLIGIGVLFLIIDFLSYSSSEFVITNKRVILKTGTFKRQLIELQLSKSDGLMITQGFLGRILGFGTIFVGAAGSNAYFTPVGDPFGFKKRVNNAIEEYIK